MRRPTILAVATLAALLAAPAVSSAQFRPLFVAPVGGFGFSGIGGYGGFGWPGYGGFGWPGLGGGYGGYGGYGYPYTFGGTGYGWGGSPYNYASYGATTSYYSIPNVGMPLTSLGGLPTRWNGVDLTGAGNLAASPSYYVPPSVTTPRSGTLPAAYNAAADVSGDLHAHVRVRLPAANGRVWFEGRPVPLTDGAGRFVSPPLDPGSRYAYEVRARWTDAAGRQHNQARSVTVRAGEHVDVSFVAPSR